MKRFVVLLAIGGALAAFGVVACGGDTDKPPLAPDTELPRTETPSDLADAAPAK